MAKTIDFSIIQDQIKDYIDDALSTELAEVKEKLAALSANIDEKSGAVDKMAEEFQEKAEAQLAGLTDTITAATSAQDEKLERNNTAQMSKIDAVQASLNEFTARFTETKQAHASGLKGATDRVTALEQTIDKMRNALK